MMSPPDSNGDLPSLDPCSSPPVDITFWAEIALTDVCTIRLPPSWSSQGIPERDSTEPPYLLCVLAPRGMSKGVDGPGASLAAWLYARTGLPVAQYAEGDATQVVERRTCRVMVRDCEVTRATWKAATRGTESTYGVAACWPVGANRWIHLQARMLTQAQQGDVVAALRTIQVQGSG